MARVTRANINEFQHKILIWYDVNGRVFPWRSSNITEYQAIIAEVLLQRTKAETVSNFFIRFIREFPGWTSLANSSNSAIEEFLKPVGLHKQRAARLHKLAVEMVKRKERLPRDRDELESIPFIGQYIANAIELIVFNSHSPLLDVNMSRVLERYFGERQMADIRYDPYLQKLSKRVVAHEKSKHINWGILDFAAMVCKASVPMCEVCVFTTNCSYFQNCCKPN